ncbi:MAG TPA: hypothetical protein VMU39_23695 [Solirubrobacteraceae bacterium]|nr:hypothetical protein [Solirubrobacteraceae bacterium]
MTRQHVWITVVAIVGAIAVPAVETFTAGPPSSPDRTIQTFLLAAATGDGATACAQLSAQAKREVVQGASCEAGITLGASMYSSIIGQLKIADLTISGDTATASSTLSGHPTATFQLKKAHGKWLIVQEQRVTAAAKAGASSAAPSEARVESVASCLDRRIGAVEDAGLDSTGGVAHAVLSVDVGGYAAAEVDVFSTALAAVAGYQGIKTADRGLTTGIAGGSVFVYLRSLTAQQRDQIASCG